MKLGCKCRKNLVQNQSAPDARILQLAKHLTQEVVIGEMYENIHYTNRAIFFLLLIYKNCPSTSRLNYSQQQNC